MVQVIFIVQGGPQGHGELLNNSHREANTRPLRHRHQNARECSKKSVQQGRSRFDARSVRCVRERERREERHVCEPEGRQNGENAAGGFFQHSQNRWWHGFDVKKDDGERRGCVYEFLITRNRRVPIFDTAFASYPTKMSI